MAKSQLTSQGAAQKRSLAGTPVFLYHGVYQRSRQVPSGESKYWISQQNLRAQLEIIRSENFAPKFLSSIWSPEGGGPALENAVVATFDDGNASDYQAAFPLLQQFGCPAEFFVNPANIGRPGFLSWVQIAEMHRAGMSFQSHGWDHVDLSSLSARETERQLRDSRHELQSRLGAPVDFLSAPYGRFDRRLIDTALEVGYRAVCCSRCLPALPRRARINRVAIYARTGGGQFARLLRGNPFSYAARLARAGILYLPKQIILSLRPQMLTVGKSGAQA